MCDCQDVVGGHYLCRLAWLFETINRIFSSPLVSIPDGAGKIGVGFFCPFSSRELEALNERISRSRTCRLG